MFLPSMLLLSLLLLLSPLLLSRGIFRGLLLLQFRRLFRGLLLLQFRGLFRGLSRAEDCLHSPFRQECLAGHFFFDMFCLSEKRKKSMSCAAIGLDIDGTITTGDPDAIQRIVDVAHTLDVPVFINTARPEKYCANPGDLTTRYVDRENHYCLPWRRFVDVEREVAEQKVRHMAHHITERRECSILVDDVERNVREVNNAGYTGIQVQYGIQGVTADRVVSKLEECCN